MSAEHGIITLVQPDDTIHVGDRFDFVVGYGDNTVFLHDNLYALRGDIVEAVWPVSGRGLLR
jgi:D-serine deaminase-like pyridoxal phosphate-dependent protein